jgi:nitrogen regulatory protein PII
MTVLHPKKKIELIIEKPALRRACRIFEDSGVTGYTYLPVLGGYGKNRRWQRGTDISATRDMVMMISITDAETCEEVVKTLGNLIGSHIGVLNVSDTEVLRKDKF